MSRLLVLTLLHGASVAASTDCIGTEGACAEPRESDRSVMLQAAIAKNDLIQEAIASFNGTSDKTNCQVSFHNLRICCKEVDLEDSDPEPEDDPCANWEADATGEQSDAYLAILEASKRTRGSERAKRTAIIRRVMKRTKAKKLEKGWSLEKWKRRKAIIRKRVRTRVLARLARKSAQKAKKIIDEVEDEEESLAEEEEEEEEEEGEEQAVNATQALAEEEKQEPGECINPSETPVSSFACPCLDQYKQECKGESTCYQNIMCTHEQVCQAWKDESCTSSMIEAGMVERSAKESEKKDSALDESLTDKCG